MLFARSTVAAARRESLIAFYGPFASALLLIAVIVSRGSSGIQEVPPALLESEQNVLLAVESNLQGTGFKPYLGQDSDSSLQIIRSAYSEVPALTANVSLPADALQPSLLKPLPPLAVVANESGRTLDSSDISIEESIQRDLDRNALLMRQQNESAEDEVTDEYTGVVFEDPLESKTIVTTDEIDSWSKLMQSVTANSNQTMAMRSAESNSPTSSEIRFQRPEGTQRPLLPPTQISRPIQRAGLLPPPIRPLIP